MSNTATSSASLSASINGVAQPPLSNSFQSTMAGTNATLLTMTATTTPTALSLGNAATIGKLLIKVLTGTGTQRIIVSLNSPATQIISDIPEGEVVLLYRPAWTSPTQSAVYVRSDTGTLQIQYAITEQ